MKVKAMSHVGLTVSDFQRAVDWYGENFGFALIDVQEMPAEKLNSMKELYGLTDASVKFGFLRAPGGQVLEIFQFTPTAQTQPACWNKPGPTHFCLDVSNVPQWYNRLKAQGVQFCCQPQTTGGNDWVFLKDPDGNLVELIDLKALRFVIKSWLGAVVAKIFRSAKFKEYYKA